MKTKKLFSASLIFLTLLTICSSSNPSEITRGRVSPEVRFDCSDACANAIIAEINNANEEILVQTCSPIAVRVAKALIDSHKKGLKVAVILDKGQQETRQYALANYLANAKIPTYVCDMHSAVPDGVMIVDRAKVFAGSFNLTKTAKDKNAENCTIVTSAELAKTYLDNWNALRNSGVIENLLR